MKKEADSFAFPIRCRGVKKAKDVFGGIQITLCSYYLKINENKSDSFTDMRSSFILDLLFTGIYSSISFKFDPMHWYWKYY